MQSQGEVSRRDLSAAYRQLGVAIHEAEQADDERIMNLFQVRQTCSGPAVQEDNRQALYKIGMHRGSQMLINASRQSIDTYKDALTWLGHGANASTEDDALIAIAGAKVSITPAAAASHSMTDALQMGDSKADEELARKAISVIAQERKSDRLNQWLLTGQTGGYEMSPDEALRILGEWSPKRFAYLTQNKTF